MNRRSLQHPSALESEVMLRATNVVCELSITLAVLAAVMDRLARASEVKMSETRAGRRAEAPKKQESAPCPRPAPMPGHMGF